MPEYLDYSLRVVVIALAVGILREIYLWSVDR